MLDDLEESTAVSQDVYRCFLHTFIEFGSTVLFARYLNAPLNQEEARYHMYEFTEAGLNGAVGSTDCTNILTQHTKVSI